VTLLTDLQDAYSRLRMAGHIVYAVSDALSPGTVLCVAETEYSYAYTVFHSEEQAQAVSAQAGLPLMHLRDAPAKIPPLPSRGRPIIPYEPADDAERLRWRTLYGPGVLR
jgi:hypothetical protein